MKEKRLRNIFYITSAILFVLMLLTSRDAGITCDEILHYNQSVSVYKYFSTHGEDQSALDTPDTHLKYYGQSYDNLSTFLIRWFKIDNIYGFRHFMSSVAGWIAIFITALFAVWLAGFRAGIFVIILFAVSPTFIGHTQNNLKDIPFALGYILSLYFALKFLSSGRKVFIKDVILLTAGISFSISIRAGGLILICYLYLFFILFYLFKYLLDKKIDIIEIRKKLLYITGISVLSFFMSTLLWPFALQNPVKNIFESYNIMAHFPDTFRQIFEGRVEWSDFMPWYYLPKSMSITIPLIVLTGVVLFCILAKQILRNGKIILYVFIIFSILFPVIYVIYENSNLYSSWRQFLFVYPGIILLAAIGFHYLFNYIEKKKLKWVLAALLVLLSVHPLKFMIKNHPYYYLYYNQLVGGLEGAYGNYETDYYYVSQTEASEWLINYVKDKNLTGPVKVKETYSLKWPFRNHTEIESSYFRNEERSLSDWDYAIIVNRYISPYQLHNNIWPPKNAIHIIYADNIPICAVIKRISKDDYYGYRALAEGKNKEAIKFFENVLQINDNDEMIFYNFAAALYNDGQYLRADSVLKKGLEIHPDFEPILMYLGNIASVQNKPDDAIRYYERLIKTNMKYFEAYVGLSKLLIDRDIMRARTLLRTCLTMNPGFKDAIVALADTYRNTNPDIAKKYDEMANSIK